MDRTKIIGIVETPASDSCMIGVFRLGAAAAVVALLLVLLDIIISMGGGDASPHTFTAIDWFKMYQDNSLTGLRMLGLINVMSLTICIPLYLAFYFAHSKVCGTYAALALILYLVGVAIYISNNAAIPMYVLSNKYAAASTEAQRVMLASAGEAIVAKSVDFTPGSFIGFFFTEIAGLILSIIILRSRIFSRVAAYSGIMSFILLIGFTIWITFISTYFEMAMIIAMIGGISGIFWYIFAARDLLRLGSNNKVKKEGDLS